LHADAVETRQRTNTSGRKEEPQVRAHVSLYEDATAEGVAKLYSLLILHICKLGTHWGLMTGSTAINSLHACLCVQHECIELQLIWTRLYTTFTHTLDCTHVLNVLQYLTNLLGFAISRLLH